MLNIATTPAPPYYAVIFTSRPSADRTGYAEMAYRMAMLAAQQPGFLGFETASQDLSITVSYWRDLDAISRWKANAEHRVAQSLGRERWYDAFSIRICKVEREYGTRASAADASLLAAEPQQ